MNSIYSIWRRQFGDHCVSSWVQTSHTLAARSDKEAAAKLRNKFAGCGFNSMSLVAVPLGDAPGALTQ